MMSDWLSAMGTDGEAADPYKVIGMLRRKIRRRRDKRSAAYNLNVALHRTSQELQRVRRDFGELEGAFMRQHLRDAVEIERLKRGT